MSASGRKAVVVLVAQEPTSMYVQRKVQYDFDP